MKKDITPTAAVASGIDEAWRDVGASFERFCLTAGIATLADMMERDAAELCGPRYGREDGRCGHRWGQAAGKLGFHGGKMLIERPRVRARNALRSLGFVGLTEDFEEEMQRLQNIFGFRSIHVPRSNASPREDMDQPIEPDVEQRIRYLTSVDAELYTAARELRRQFELTSAMARGQLGNSG